MNIYIRSQDLDLCKYLDDPSLNELSPYFSEADFPSGAVISKSGARIDSIIVLIDGKLESIAPNGKVQEQIYTGEMTQELHYVMDCPSSSELRASRASKVALISFADLDRFIGEDPQRAARIQAAINDSLCLKIIRLTHLEG